MASRTVSPTITETASKVSRPGPAGNGRVPWATVSTARTSPARWLPARARASLAEDAGEAAEAGAEYGVLAGGEELAGGDPAGDQLEAADGQNRDQDKGADDRGLGAGAGQDLPGEQAVLVQLGEEAEDAAFFAGVRARRR